MIYHYRFYNFYMLNLLFLILFVSCASPTQSLSERDAQIETIKEKLEPWLMTKREAACDGCGFEMQEAVSREVSKVDDDRVGITRAKSGVRVFYFEGVSIEEAFLTLLDSNFFAERFDRDGKILLLQAIANGENDLSFQDTFDEIGENTFASITFAKRPKNATQAKIIIDSVNAKVNFNREFRYSDTIEGYIVGSEIVIINFYGGSQSWRR